MLHFIERVKQLKACKALDEADEQQFSPLGRAVMALELGVGAIKNGDGPGAALKAMMRYGSDDVIPPGVA